MKRFKSIIALMMIVIMILPNIIFAEELIDFPELVELIESMEPIEISEFNSEIKYGPFTTGHLDPEVSDERIDLYSTDLEIASNYRELRDAITKYMKNYENSFSISYKGNTSTLQDDIERIWNDIFSSDDYLYGTISTYGPYKYSGYENDVIITFSSLTYHTDKAQEKFVDSQVIRITNEIIEPNMSDFEKVKNINDWIVNNTKYTFDAGTSVHAAYTLFNEGKGVCQAYALATYKLLEEAGFDVRYVTGDAGGDGEKIAHAWNLLQLGGKWYHLDTTWNDPLSESGDDILSYDYFLISDATISKDHRMDNRVYPRASDTRYELMRGIQNPYEHDNIMYYGNSQDGSKLYKFNLRGMEKTMLTEDRALYLTGYEDWIYYSNYSKGAYIHKIRIDGSGNTPLNSVHSTHLSMDFPYLHFYDNTNKKWDKMEVGQLIKVTGISLNRTEDIALTVGGQAVELEATITPADATNRDIIWTSDNPSVVTVKDGVITPIKAGSSTITVETVDGGYTASLEVTVKDGYKLLALNKKETNTKHPWTIKLSKPVDAISVDYASLYIEDEFGEKLNEADFEIRVSEEDNSMITITNQSSYEKNKLYYVVVENNLISIEEGKPLKEAVKLPFIIK